MSSPSFVVPWKNSTLLTVPSLSDAFALIVMLAGAVKLAPLAGLVMLTSGGLFDGAGGCVDLPARSRPSTLTMAAKASPIEISMRATMEDSIAPQKVSTLRALVILAEVTTSVGYEPESGWNTRSTSAPLARMRLKCEWHQVVQGEHSTLSLMGWTRPGR